jgi:sensor histidine kinase YesM
MENLTNKLSKKSKLDDRILLFLGIPLLAIVAFLVFSNDEFDGDTRLAMVGIAGSLLSTLVMWLGVRKIVIFLWNKYPWEKHPIKHLIIEVLAIVGYTTLAGLILFMVWYIYNPDLITKEDIGLNIFFTLTITFLITSLHEGYFFFMQWKHTLVLSEKLEKENIQSQYETLKSQISPHFLFNNLNTLTNLIEEEPKLAVEYVQRTADYYRSILNMRDMDVIPLENELKLIEDYYFLQKKRYGNNLSLLIDIPDEVRKSAIVAPLTLQMLFENAIKHNIIAKEKPLNISIKSEDDYIVVENNLQRRQSDEISNRIGLQNISNRYRFLSDREIVVLQDSNNFIVKVPVLRTE